MPYYWFFHLHTDFNYFELLGKVEYLFPIKAKIEERFHLLTDGDPDTIYQYLITYGSRILTIHVGRKFLGVNKWIVERTKKYYQDQGIFIALSLIEEESYSFYDKVEEPIVIYGFQEFVLGTKNLFEDKNVILSQNKEEIC